MRYHPLMKVCFNCGGQIELDRRPLRMEECPHCRGSLHCCRNCRFHDPSVHNECTEPNSDMVRDREGPNFCDYFEFALGERGNEGGQLQEAKDKLAGLFKI